MQKIPLLKSCPILVFGARSSYVAAFRFFYSFGSLVSACPNTMAQNKTNAEQYIWKLKKGGDDKTITVK